MALDAALASLRSDPAVAGGFVHWRTLPPEPARYGVWPEGLAPSLLAALARRGIDRPYTHQATAIAGVLAGRDQVVVTPTASGKTLCYNVPVIDVVMRDPAARALYLL